MDARCASCGGALPPIEVGEAGALALKMAESLVCDNCATPEGKGEEELIQERRLRSGIPSAWLSSLDSLSADLSPTAVEVAIGWGEGEFPLLSLFGRGDAIPDRLAATAAMRRLEIGGVRWRSAGDPVAREAAIGEMGTGAAIVLADLDQAMLLKQSMSEVLTIVTHRQREGLPLLVTSAISQPEISELTRRAADSLLFRLRKFGKAVHVDRKEEP